LAELGGGLLVSALELIASDQVRPLKQDGGQSSYAHMLSGEDEVINWERDALSIKNQVRGLNPWPVARTYLRDKLLKVWRVDIQDTERRVAGIPGQVLHASANRGIIVQTGSGIVNIRELQLQGKKRMSVEDFLKGNPISDGTKLVPFL